MPDRGRCGSLIQRVDRFDFFIASGEIKNLRIGFQMLAFSGLGDGHNALLNLPSQCDLAGRLAVLLTDAFELLKLEHFAFDPRTPRFDLNAVALTLVH